MSYSYAISFYGSCETHFYFGGHMAPSGSQSCSENKKIEISCLVFFDLNIEILSEFKSCKD